IDKLRKALDVLESRQAVAKEALRPQKGISHPLRRVPAELLREIFRVTACIERDFDSSLQMGKLGFPWNISHVCQRWREISISYPALWSVI
ncbi:hypothetical protein C8J56DRAFT_730652, partial [Mycena floridula]